MPQHEVTAETPAETSATKTVGIVGLLSAAAGGAYAAPRTPQEAITWTDAGVHFVSEAGMPGIILVLLVALCGTIYYYECRKIPELVKRWDDKQSKREQKEDDYEEEIKELNKQALAYRDTVLEKLQKIITDATKSNATLEEILRQVLAFLQTKKGTSNGSS